MNVDQPTHGRNLRSTSKRTLRSSPGRKVHSALSYDTSVAAASSNLTTEIRARKIKPLKKTRRSRHPAKSSDKDAPPQLLYTIPEALATEVQILNASELAFVFSLEHLAKTQRLIFGLPAAVSHLVVRLKYTTTTAAADKPSDATIGYCVYCVAGKEKPILPPHYRYPGRTWSNAGLVGVGIANVLTYDVAQVLHVILGDESARGVAPCGLQEIYDRVSAILGDKMPASFCQSCGNDLKVSLPVYRSTTCGEKSCREVFDGAPLSIRLSPFLVEPSTLDFLLCSVYSVPNGMILKGYKDIKGDDAKELNELEICPGPTPKGLAKTEVKQDPHENGHTKTMVPKLNALAAAKLVAEKEAADKVAANRARAQSYANDMLPECPIQWGHIQSTINSFPPMDEVSGPSDIVGSDEQEKDEKDDQETQPEAPERKRRRMLLSWITNSFRGCLVPAPKASGIEKIPAVLTFMMLNSDPERYRTFASQLQATSEAKKTPLGGWAVFHGTPPLSVFNILREGLQDTSKRATRYGIYSDAGIFCSDLAAYSQQYAVKNDTNLQTWKHSALPKNSSVVFGCELAQKDEPAFYGGSYSEYCFHDEDSVTIRYVFLIDKALSGTWSASAKDTRPPMEDVYRSLHAGRLLKD